MAAGGPGMTATNDASGLYPSSGGNGATQQQQMGQSNRAAAMAKQ